MFPKRSDYTDMCWIFSIGNNFLISQRLTRNSDGSDKALYERLLKELALLLHLNEQIITCLHKTHKDMHHSWNTFILQLHDVLNLLNYNNGESS